MKINVYNKGRNIGYVVKGNQYVAISKDIYNHLFENSDYTRLEKLLLNRTKDVKKVKDGKSLSDNLTFSIAAA